MTSLWHRYQQGKVPIPDKNLSWPFYGDGLASLGLDGKPVAGSRPNCGRDQLLVRVDALGLCASDAKMIRMGYTYPLFFERDFSRNPARLGHEVALTVIEVGLDWQDRFYPGQRLGIQPNVYLGGKRMIFGVNIPGGMTQYLTIGPEILAGDEGSYVFPVPPELSYVDIALLEPWACVDVAYTPLRRLEPKPEGVMWIKGRPGGTQRFVMGRPLTSKRVILTDVPAEFAAWVRTQPVEVLEHNWLSNLALSETSTGGTGFDDIILLDPCRAQTVAEAIDVLAAYGTLNLVTTQPLDCWVPVDVHRVHYEHLAFVGCAGPDVAQAYGLERNRSELRAGGVTLIIGAGGSMGRLHTQRALEMADGPRAVVVTNRGQARLASLVHDFKDLAKAQGRELVAVSPQAEPGRLGQEIDRLTGGRGCDDVVVIVPDAQAVKQALSYLAEDGLLVLFAGVRAGSRVELPLDRVALHNAQFTGTSGSTVADELRVLEKIQAGLLSPARSLAAVGGMQAVTAGLGAVIDRVYPGKIVIFPQLVDLPLLSLGELRTLLPEVYARLGPNETWTVRAEQALFEHYLSRG